MDTYLRTPEQTLFVRRMCVLAFFEALLLHERLQKPSEVLLGVVVVKGSLQFSSFGRSVPVSKLWSAVILMNRMVFVVSFAEFSCFDRLPAMALLFWAKVQKTYSTVS